MNLKRSDEHKMVDQVIGDILPKIDRIEYLARFFDDPAPSRKLVASMRLALKTYENSK